MNTQSIKPDNAMLLAVLVSRWIQHSGDKKARRELDSKIGIVQARCTQYEIERAYACAGINLKGIK
jgi:hypothetical protein